MKGSEIVVEGNPKGLFLEGIVSGTPKPGTIMEIKASTEPVLGRHTWQASSKTSGVSRLIAILLNDDLQGQLATTAYVSGTRGKLYVPAEGESVNVLFENQAGTGDAFAIGDLAAVKSNGKIIANSAYDSTPFTVMETTAAIAADTLIWCLYNGN